VYVPQLFEILAAQTSTQTAHWSDQSNRLIDHQSSITHKQQATKARQAYLNRREFKTEIQEDLSLAFAMSI
jgi:hypothetical protein